MLKHSNAKIEMLTFTSRFSEWVVVSNGYTEVRDLQSI